VPRGTESGLKVVLAETAPVVTRPFQINPHRGSWTQRSMSHSGLRATHPGSCLRFDQAAWPVCSPATTNQGRWTTAPIEIKSAKRHLVMNGKVSENRVNFTDKRKLQPMYWGTKEISMDFTWTEYAACKSK